MSKEVWVSNFAIAKAATVKALRDPKVGDRLQEMLSHWVYVVAVEGDQVITMSASAPCTFPADAKVRRHTRRSFREHYGGDRPWLLLEDRGNNVEGWLESKNE
jgi:hypothetical protein